MADYHRYEAWLDELDKKLYVDGSVVRVEFDEPFTISLFECPDVRTLKLCALTLRAALSKNKTPLSVQYLVERFARLVVKANRIPVNAERLVRELREEWASDK